MYKAGGPVKPKATLRVLKQTMESSLTKSRLRLLLLPMLALLFGPLSESGAADHQMGPPAAEALRSKGNLLRLQGHFAAANQIQRELVERYPNDPIGYVFNLNTMVTQLTWNEADNRFDDQIRADANRVLALCKDTVETDADASTGYYHCGQAHFALSYLSALRGGYYQAGRHGKLAIAELETALALNPHLIDARMHLGVAYYHADHLPAYLKALSWFLWFIPQGNSDKSLPYLRDVMTRGRDFRDVAKYLYADLRIYEGPDGQREASEILAGLVRDYPENERFHLRHISLLLERGLNQETIAAGEQLLRTQPDVAPLHEALVRLWITRAYLALQDLVPARRAFAGIDLTLAEDPAMPPWGLGWLLITYAQMLDLNGERDEAIATYQRLLGLTDENHMNPVVLVAATRGLETPFNGGAAFDNTVFD